MHKKFVTLSTSRKSLPQKNNNLYSQFFWTGFGEQRDKYINKCANVLHQYEKKSQFFVPKKSGRKSVGRKRQREQYRPTPSRNLKKQNKNIISTESKLLHGYDCNYSTSDQNYKMSAKNGNGTLASEMTIRFFCVLLRNLKLCAKKGQNKFEKQTVPSFWNIQLLILDIPPRDRCWRKRSRRESSNARVLDFCILVKKLY